jgi:hypothetical protein
MGCIFILLECEENGVSKTFGGKEALSLEGVVFLNQKMGRVNGLFAYPSQVLKPVSVASMQIQCCPQVKG